MAYLNVPIEDIERGESVKGLDKLRPHAAEVLEVVRWVANLKPEMLSDKILVSTPQDKARKLKEVLDEK